MLQLDLTRQLVPIRQSQGQKMPQNDVSGENSSIDYAAGRRAFLGAVGLGAASSLALSSYSTDADAQPAALSPADVFNFTLNFEYLGFRYYDIALRGYAALRPFGTSIPGEFSSTSPSAIIRYYTFLGTGTSETPRGGHKVLFQDPLIRAVAEEFGADELAHVTFLRSILGDAAIAQTRIDFDQGFTAFGRFSGLVPPDGTFDAFANDDNFLIGAMILEDVCVTALKGAVRFIRNNEFLEGAAGLLATEAYQAGIIRTLMAQRGLFKQAQQVSDLRDYFDGPSDIDQGIGAAQQVNIVPADNNSIAFSRTPEQVRNIAYGTTNGQPGGFFPLGLNGVIR